MAELRHQIPINASPDKVYAALATQAGLRGWWTADARVDEKVGGKAEFGFEKRKFVIRMMIERLYPGRQLVWTCYGDNPEWDETTLTWNITSEDSATMLRFTQSGWKSVTDLYAMCNSTWGELMYRLKDYVEDRNPGPRWKE
jgi:uncharacterized protein YndB with AHSA1/START domain